MTLHLELRPSTLDDAGIVADLQMERDPDDVTDPVLMRYWWQMTEEMQRAMRQVAVEDGAALAYVGAQHERWPADGARFGVVRAMLRRALWSEETYTDLVAVGERWLRQENATTFVMRVREDFRRELAVLDRLGYREDRRMQTSELDLASHRDEIARTVEECRREMRRQGVDIHPLSADTDPDRLHQLYEMITESEQDIPRTVPWRVLTFAEWQRFWLGNPGIREDRFWIAREDGRIVGTSVLDCPVVRGIPWTAFTGTVRSVRGRGIAKALKYESMAQALEAGYTRVRTNNDADNPSILRINNRMGYRLVAPIIELHRPAS